MKNFYDFLSQTELFFGIDPLQIQKMLHCLEARRRTFDRSHLIIMAGDEIKSVALVLCGAVDIMLEDSSGKSLMVTTVGPGGIFSENCADKKRKTSPVSAIAASEGTEILFIEYERLVRTCSNVCGFHTRLIENMLQYLSEKNRELAEKISVLSQYTIREKLLSYLLLHTEDPKGSVRVPYNRTKLAEYLCVDRSAMSRELSRMQKEGILRCEGDLFQILRLPSND